MASKLKKAPTITENGLTLAVNRNNQHLSLTITHISFGSSKYEPTGQESALRDERLKTSIDSAVKTTNKTLQLRATTIAPKGQSFWCNEIGFWDGQTLVAVYSSNLVEENGGNGLFYISDNIETTVSYALSLTALPVENIDVVIHQNQDRLFELLQIHENAELPHRQLTPKTLTASTSNRYDETGHSHEINKASTTQAGIVQLTNNINSDSETHALTAKAGKRLVQQIAENKLNTDRNFIQHSKKSNAIDSNSTDTVATSAAVNTLNSRLNVAKIAVKGGNTAITFDLTNRSHWIAEIGAVYKHPGHFQLVFHNITDIHHITAFTDTMLSSCHSTIGRDATLSVRYGCLLAIAYRIGKPFCGNLPTTKNGERHK